MTLRTFLSFSALAALSVWAAPSYSADNKGAIPPEIRERLERQRAEQASGDQPPPMVTLFLKREGDETQDEAVRSLETRTNKRFPPAGAKIEAWHMLEGAGHVITLSVAPERLAAVNAEISELLQTSLKGGEAYPASDVKPAWQKKRSKD